MGKYKEWLGGGHFGVFVLGGHPCTWGKVRFGGYKIVALLELTCTNNFNILEHLKKASYVGGNSFRFNYLYWQYIFLVLSLEVLSRKKICIHDLTWN